jgi:hypothetical protein
MADQVTLKNGDRLTGSIVKSDAKTLLIKTEFAGEVNVQWDAVSGMVSSQPLHLALKDAQTIVGTVTAADTKLKKWLSWQITLSDRFHSDPLPGLKKNDLLLTTGVRVTFGNGAF